ncbi:hypothetical protein DPEC_G00315900 [Dallia pectoralis]|uniref:Uncharacterized protein n=1 Tax=Dallia pectoralis TaxID=75939 RepID=A0ACC2FCT9_DALPE|nr:hypothetical protein DPEC_G00315900 [Dallia pectoralis]
MCYSTRRSSVKLFGLQTVSVSKSFGKVEPFQSAKYNPVLTRSSPGPQAVCASPDDKTTVSNLYTVPALKQPFVYISGVSLDFQMNGQVHIFSIT